MRQIHTLVHHATTLCIICVIMLCPIVLHYDIVVIYFVVFIAMFVLKYLLSRQSSPTNPSEQLHELIPFMQLPG